MRWRRAAPQRSPGLTEPYRAGQAGPAAAGCERVSPPNPDAPADKTAMPTVNGASSQQQTA